MEEYSLWSQLMQQFRKSCSDFDGLWIKRKRLFDTELMMKSLLQLVSGAQKSYHQTLDQLLCEDNVSAAASSFCEARARFPSGIVRELREEMLASWDDVSSSRKQWFGFNIYAVDGSRTNLPRGLIEDGFKLARSGYYPQALVSMLVRLEDRMICDITLTPRKDERAQAMEHLAYLGRGDLVIYDRGYFSFALFNAHLHQGVHALFRLPQGTSFSQVEEFWAGKELEKVVILDPSYGTYHRAEKVYSDHSLKPVKLRLIKYKIKKETYVLASTLLGKEITRSAFIKLYKKRWQIEETYKPLKKTLELEDFHSESLNGIEQEVEAMALYWNLHASLVKQAEPRLTKKPNHLPRQANYRQSLLKLSRSLKELFSRVSELVYKALKNTMIFIVKSS